MLINAILPIVFGAFGMVAAFMIYANIIKTPSGEGRVKEIADEIHLGAMVFMASEYKRLAIFCLICIIALYASLGADTAIALPSVHFVLVPPATLACTQQQKPM